MSLRDPYSPILPNLCQGGVRALQEHGREFDVVVNLSSEEYTPRWGQLYARFAIPDGDPPDHRKLLPLARMVAQASRNGLRVLVNCDAGLNRSGLVVALALMENGYSADDAIELIRARRDGMALCNAGFEMTIRRLEW